MSNADETTGEAEDEDTDASSGESADDTRSLSDEDEIVNAMLAEMEEIEGGAMINPAALKNAGKTFGNVVKTF